MSPSVLYEHLVFTALLTAIAVLFRSFWGMKTTLDQLVSVYLLLITGFIASSYFSMHAVSETAAQFWSTNIKLNYLSLYFFVLMLLLYTIARPQNKLPARLALYIQAANTTMLLIFLLVPGLQSKIVISSRFVLHGDIWLRETWRTGPVHVVFTLVELLCSMLLIISHKDLFKKVFVDCKFNLRERQMLIFLSALLFPQMISGLTAYQLLGPFNHYNLMPAIQAGLGFFTLYSTRRNYNKTLPQSKTWIFNNLQDPLLVVSPNLELLEANPAAIEQSGLNLAGYYGKDVRETFPQLANIINQSRKKVPGRIKLHYDTPQGNRAWYNASLSPLTGASGRDVSTIILLRNITAETLLTEQLMRERKLNGWIDQRFESISLQLTLSEALQKTLGILFELVPFDAAEIIITEGTSTRTAASLDISGILPASNTPKAHIHAGRFSLTRDDETLGALLLYNQERAESYSAETRAKMDLFTFRLSSLLANLLDIESGQEQVREKERQRFASEIHDSVTQTLQAAFLTIQVIQLSGASLPTQLNNNIMRITMLIEGAEQELRSLLYELKPAVLSHTSLAEILQSLVNASRLRTKVALSLHSDHIQEPPPHVKQTIYRIAQEALSNAIRHANAKNIGITLETDHQNKIILHIRDDGQGVELRQPLKNTHGLAILKERASSIQASLDIDSTPGTGTHIRLSWPA